MLTTKQQALLAASALAIGLVSATSALAQQGRSLGNPNGAHALRRAARGNLAALAAVRAAAAKRAEDLRETILDVVASGLVSHAAVG